MLPEPRHIWIVAPYLRDRQACWETLKPAGISYEVDCHRNLRGPYTGVGSLLRQLVPIIYEQCPEHVSAHAVEILSLAPELSSFLTISTHTLTSLAVPKERTRFYSRYRTLRMAHGITDFLKGCISLGVFSRLVLFFENVQAADPLDQELLGVLLRRTDPANITLVVGTTQEELPTALASALTSYAWQVRAEPLTRSAARQFLQSWQLPETWQEWLEACDQRWLGEIEPLQALSDLLVTLPPQGNTLAEGMRALAEQVSAETRQIWAKAWIAADGASDNKLIWQAYQLSDEEERRQWHDERASTLEEQKQFSLSLGALPYHRERGSEPASRGAATLRAALDYCIDMGYYEATVDMGQRGRAVIDWGAQVEYYWVFTTKMTTSLAALERPEEAEKLYNEARSLFSSPSLHMQAAYATAMLYTRHHKAERRNHVLAKGWINEAIAFASLDPDPKERAFNVVFNRNGLALIEAHLGNPQEALRLVTEGLERLEQELESDEHLLHRSVLRYNRAQVYAGLGQLDAALADYTAVIQQDPHYSEYYFDRGNIYRRLGREEEALADYSRAIRYSPPYPEAYYNRAGVLSVLEREEEALADYTYVLELDPTHLDALVNRSGIFYERGEYGLARQDAERGLQLDARNAQLLCTLGLLEMAEEDLDGAERTLSRAIECDPSLVAAWTNRAILAFERGENASAIADLTHALSLEENATVLYNRGIAYQAQGAWQKAVEDLSRALALDEAEAQDIFYRRGLCYLQLNESSHAQSDFASHLAYGSSPYESELRALQLTPMERQSA